MSKELSADDKIGIISHEFEQRSKESYEKAIARVWNDSEGRSENKVWKIIKSSGKGFYDSRGEILVLHKPTGAIFLASVHTNHFGRQGWKSPDYVQLEGIMEQQYPLK